MTVIHTPTTQADRPDTLGAPPIKQRAGVLLAHAAGYAAYRATAIGLRSGLIALLADRPATADDLAARAGLDPFYVRVWCRGAIAYGICVRGPDEQFVLDADMATLLLDDTSPAYLGALFEIFSQREMFDRFEQVFSSGDRLWWNECSTEWITAVSRTAIPFYTRFIPALDRIPGVAEKLSAGTTVADLGSGLGIGLVKLAQRYPHCRVVGVDGDQASIDLARERVGAAGVTERVDFVHSPLESLDSPEEFGVVVTNLTMHECRDVDETTRRVWRSLEPDGWFCISDFPFPEDDNTLRTPPGRIMQGIQFFEAQIDDQLLPRSFYDDLLARHGFTDIGRLDLTPVHAVTYGRRPRS